LRQNLPKPSKNLPRTFKYPSLYLASAKQVPYKFLNKEVMKKIGKITIQGKSGNIYLSDYTEKHIQKRHAKELEQIGMTAELFVKTIIREYTEVRESKIKDRYLLVINNHLAKVAIIDFKYKDGEYQVVTAYPVKIEKIKNLKIIKLKK
jgi:hypothetical protein